MLPANIIDGNLIAEEIKKDLLQKTAGKALQLAVILVGENPASLQYVAKKCDFGAAVGISVTIHKFKKDITQGELASAVQEIVDDPAITGVLVQLPLPKHIDIDVIVNFIPPEKDVDALGSAPLILSPVVRAIAEIFHRFDVSLKGKKIAVLGAQGRLVGKPIVRWLQEQGIQAIGLDKDVQDITAHTRDADIIISGTGQTGIIKPDMVREGTILIDAGTSTTDGMGGDVDPDCFKKTLLYTPVPGGLGPITVAMLFKNVVELGKMKF